MTTLEKIVNSLVTASPDVLSFIALIAVIMLALALVRLFMTLATSMLSVKESFGLINQSYGELKLTIERGIISEERQSNLLEQNVAVLRDVSDVVTHLDTIVITFPTILKEGLTPIVHGVDSANKELTGLSVRAESLREYMQNLNNTLNDIAKINHIAYIEAMRITESNLLQALEKIHQVKGETIQ